MKTSENKADNPIPTSSHDRIDAVCKIIMFVLAIVASAILAIVILFHIITGILIFNSGKAEFLDDNVGSYVRLSIESIGVANEGMLGGFAIVSDSGRFMAQITIISVEENGRIARFVRTYFLDSWDLDCIEVLEPMFPPRD